MTEGLEESKRAPNLWKSQINILLELLYYDGEPVSHKQLMRAAGIKNFGTYQNTIFDLRKKFGHDIVVAHRVLRAYSMPRAREIRRLLEAELRKPESESNNGNRGDYQNTPDYRDSYVSNSHGNHNSNSGSQEIRSHNGGLERDTAITN